MHHQTHDKFGRHVHHVVFDLRSLKSAQDVNLGINNQTEEPTVSSSRPVKRQDEQKQNSLHSKQLDTLYWQLDSLKQNMMEKQTCLANIIDVQKKMIQQQSHMILDLNEKVNDKNNDESRQVKTIGETSIKQNEKTKQQNFSELYQKSAIKLKVESEVEDHEYEDVYTDDDTDSFITIDTDEDIDSDGTIENSQSSDSGYTDYNDHITSTNNNSYGINPMFLHQSDGTESCEDFVFFKQNKDNNEKMKQKMVERSGLQTIPEKLYDSIKEPRRETLDLQSKSGSLKRSHRIVIINNESALVCNESCLI